ncbi:MAG: DegV family protein [Christensenellaceae bacterium]|nr:DegV family protein [Christensenellaceae bacterium]
MIRIVSDSTCDLSPELLAEYQVSLLPLSIILDEQAYLDGSGITPEEIYAWSDNQHASPKTAAFSLEQAIDCFRPLLGTSDELICFAISETMSASAQVMRLAAAELGTEDRVHVVDSQSLSTGVGLLVIEAALMARQGRSAADILTAVEALRPKVRASFVVDTLTYLHRGGRCSGLAAMMGGALRLHPRISVENGKMQPGKKYRGSMDRVIRQYVTDMRDDLLAAKTDRVFITHSGCPDGQVAEVRAWLEELHHFDAIHVTRAGGVISSHCGPGTLGVLFIDGR